MEAKSTGAATLKLPWILLSVILTGGCSSGPYHQPAFDVPSLQAAKGFTEIIVSGFVTAEKTTSVTGSLDIQTIMESASVFDMSQQVAAALQQSGVRAEARDKFDRTGLQPNQLLLRGAVVASKDYDTRYGAWLAPYLLTLGIFGLWFPSPFTFEEGFEVKYRVDLIDSTGRYLLSTGSKDSKIFIKARHVVVSRPDAELLTLMRQNMADEIAKKVRI